MRIAIDLDDVLSSFIAEFLRWYNTKYGTSWQFEDFADYHWSNWMNITREQAIKAVHNFFLTPEFANLPVIPGAQEFIRRLANQHELHIVTSRQYVAETITYAWLEKNFPGVFRGVLFANHYSMDGSPALTKGELCEQASCELIIDDDSRHIGALVEHHIKMVLIDKPWNKNDQLPAGVIRVYNWEDATQAVEKLLPKSIAIN